MTLLSVLLLANHQHGNGGGGVKLHINFAACLCGVAGGVGVWHLECALQSWTCTACSNCAFHMTAVFVIVSNNSVV